MTLGAEPLPDLLREGLDVVFVGTAAGRRSAAVSAYYAHPGNRFWRTLAAIGLTPHLYLPHQFRDLLVLGIGFTDMSKSASGMDHEIPLHTYDVVIFEQKIRRYSPRIVAFTSKKAASIWLAQPTAQIVVGRQAKRADFPEVFVLPSPSGVAISYWNEAPWRELAGLVSLTRTSAL